MQSGQEKVKLFNVRFLPLFAAFLILGIFSVKVSYTVAAILLFVAAVCSFALFFTKNVKWGVAVALVLVFLLGFGIAKLDLHFRNDVRLSGKTQLTCRVTEVTLKEGQETDAIIDGETEEDPLSEVFPVFVITADKVKAGGKSYGGGVTFETTEVLAVGDRLTLFGDVKIKELSLADFSQSMAYRKGCKYEVTDPEVLLAQSGAAPHSERIKTEARVVFCETQGTRAGGFSYAMLFGDAEYMESGDKTAMRAVGVAHVFAISGLHVGVLAAALLLLLRKLKVKDGISALILLPIFGFYAYLVGFTPSVLRASIMVLVGLAASHFGARYDDLSSLSLAAILILLFRPLLLFDLSFVMSFLAIFGLHSLSGPLTQAFERKGLKKGLAAALALSVSTTVALLPVFATVFGQVSLVGVVLNLLVVPLASVAYILNLIGLLLTAALPAFGVFLKAVAIIPSLIAEISVGVASWGLTASYDFMAAEILVYYAILGFVGKYSLAPKKAKLVAGGVGAGVLAILFFAV